MLKYRLLRYSRGGLSTSWYHGSLRKYRSRSSRGIASSKAVDLFRQGEQVRPQLGQLGADPLFPSFRFRLQPGAEVQVVGDRFLGVQVIGRAALEEAENHVQLLHEVQREHDRRMLEGRVLRIDRARRGCS